MSNLTQFQQGVGYPAEEPMAYDDEGAVGDVMADRMMPQQPDPNPYQEGGHGYNVPIRELLWPATGYGSLAEEKTQMGPAMPPPNDMMMDDLMGGEGEMGEGGGDKEAMRDLMAQKMRHDDEGTDEYQQTARMSK